MSNRAYDAIIIGGGHNGLIAAAYLAKAGQRVLLLEAASHLGGAASETELAPGIYAPALAHLIETLPRNIERDLKLGRHGLQLPKQSVSTIVLNEDGRHLHLSNPARLEPALSETDKAALKDFRRELAFYAGLLRPFLAQGAASAGSHLRARLQKALLRLFVSRHGDASQLLHLLPQSIGDRLDSTFENPQLKAALAADALLGGHSGPYEPGTWFSLVYKEALRGLGRGHLLPAGGIGRFTSALAEAAAELGVEIELGVRVTRIMTRSEMVTGVETETGATYSAQMVLSSLDPVITFGTLVGYANFEAQTAKRLTRNLSRGMSAKINLLLDAQPLIRGLDSQDINNARLLIVSSLGELDRSYIQAKRSKDPLDPLYEIVPSATETGSWSLSIIKHYAPWENDEAVNPLEMVLHTLDRHIPGIERSILAGEYLAPNVIEKRFSLRGGGWYQGDLRMDQLLALRPSPGLAQEAPTVSGLYLCGAGSHLGGGLSGLPGKFAAEAALARRFRK